MAKLNSLTLILGVIVVIIIICLIVGIVRRKAHIDKESADRSSSASDSSSSSSESSGSSSSSASRSRSHPRHRARTAARPSNYRVMNGRPVDASQVKANASRPQAPVAEEQFPRVIAKAGKESYAETMDKVLGHEARSNRSSSDRRSNVSVSSANIETVEVQSIADLFSPKEDIEADLGVDQETLDMLVQQYKDGKEYKERKLPVNRHFNMDSYKASKASLRESAINVNNGNGSKRGQITSAIYKKYGKNFTTKKSQNVGDVMSTISSDQQHRDNLESQKGRRNPGHLEVHA